MYVILTSKSGQFRTECGVDLRPVETWDYVFCGRKRAQFVIAELLRDTKVRIVDESTPPVINLVPSKLLPRFDSVDDARSNLRKLAGVPSADLRLTQD